MNKDEFDYAGYAAAAGVETQPGDLENPALRDVLYEDAVTTTVKGFKSSQFMNNEAAILETEKLLGDTRSVLGLSALRTPEEQDASLGIYAYKKYLRENRLDQMNGEGDLDAFVSGYVRQLADDNWANPDIAGRTAAENQSILKSRLEGVEQDTIAEWLKEKYQLNEVPLKQIDNDPVTKTRRANEPLFTEEQKENMTAFQRMALAPAVAANDLVTSANEFGTRAAPAFRRSVYSDDIQNAVSNMFDISPTYSVDEVGDFADFSGPGGRPAITTTTRDKTPEEITKERDAAVSKFITGVRKRDEIPLDAGLASVLQAEDIRAAFTEVMKDPATMAIVLAEQGVDVLEEGAIQIGTTAVGSALTTPVGGITAGSAAMSAQVYQNTYNSFLDQEIEKHLAENKLELNEENVKAFLDNPEAVANAKERASTSATIISGGAFASGLIGGGIGIASVGKLAAKLGLRPVVQGSEVVFESVVKPSVGALAAAGTVAAGIDVASDIGSKLAIGDEINPGEVVLTLGVSGVGAGVDVASGVVARAGQDSGEPTQVRVGDKLVDTDGNELLVAGGRGGVLDVVGDVKEASVFGEGTTTQRFQINGVDIGSKYQLLTPEDTTITPQGFDDTGTPESEAGKRARDFGSQLPSRTSDHDITQPDSISLTVETQGSDSAGDIGADRVNYHTQRVAVSGGQGNGLDTPTELTFADAFSGEFGFSEFLDRVGDAAARGAEQGDVDFTQANIAIAEGFADTGLIQRIEGRGYAPVYDDAVIPDQQMVQLQSWMAEVANSAMSDVADAPNPVQQVPTLPAPNRISTAVRGASTETTPFVFGEDPLQQTPQTPEGAISSFNDLIAAADNDRVNAERTTESAEGVLARLIREKRNLRLEARALPQSEYANLNQRERQINDAIAEVERYLGINVTDSTGDVKVNLKDSEIVLTIRDGVDGTDRIETAYNTFVERDGKVGLLQRRGATTSFVEEDGTTTTLVTGFGINTLDDFGLIPVDVSFDKSVEFDVENNSFVFSGNRYEYVREGEVDGEPTVIASFNGEETEITDIDVVFDVLSQKIDAEVNSNFEADQIRQAILATENNTKGDNDAISQNEPTGEQVPVTNDGTAVSDGSTRTEQESDATPDATGAEQVAREQDASEIVNRVEVTEPDGVLGDIVPEDDGSLLTPAAEEAFNNLPPPPGFGEAVNSVVPVVKRAVEINFGGTPGNFIPNTVLAEIQDAGYAVEVQQNSKGDITGLVLSDNDVPDRTVEIQTVGKSNRAETNRDRKVKVLVNGKEIKSAGGNKRFIVPPERPIIQAGENFLDSLDLAAQTAGMEVRREAGQGVGERSVYGKNPGPKSRVAVFSHDGDSVYVDGVRSDVPVGLDKQTMTVKDKVKAKSDSLRKALMNSVNVQRPLREPVLNYHQRDAQRLENIVDALDENYDVVGANDKGQYVVRTGTNELLVDAGGDDPNDVLRQAEIDATHFDTQAFDGNRQTGNRDFTPQDFDVYLNALPAHIRDIIVLHNEPDNPAANMKALGFFAPDYLGNGPQIHIDIRPAVQTFEGVLSTLSEEVAHFSFNSWTTGFSLKGMEGFYSKAFELFKPEIVGSLRAYIDKYGVDINQPDPVHQFVLVNELFSKQGTSIVDFVDNKAVSPAGLTDQEINDLRVAGRESVDNFTFNLAEIEGIQPEQKEAVKAFARSILTAQSSGVTGKRVTVEYESGNSRMRIVPTAVGQARLTLPNTDVARTVERRVNNVAGRTGSLGWLTKKYYQNLPWENGLSLREAQRIITANTAIATSRANKHFAQNLTIARRANAIMKARGEANPNGQTFADGYERAFRRVGATSERELDVAIKADEYLTRVFHIAVDDVEAIKTETRQHTDMINRFRDEGIMNPFTAAKAIQSIENNARRYKIKWDHVRYRAYEDANDQLVLREMLEELGPTKLKRKTLVQQKEDAEAEIRRVQADSSISEGRGNEIISEQNQIIEKYRRFKHLEMYFRLKDSGAAHPKRGRSDRETVSYVPEMTQFLTDLLDKTSEYQGSGFGRLNRISANMSSKLDQNAAENTSDWHYIRFLKPIDDPLEVAVYNTHQRQEILRQLKANRRLAETLLFHGQASPVGNDGSTTATGQLALMEGQAGSVLDFVQVNAIVAGDIREQVAVQSQVNAHILNRWLGLIKQGQTVWDTGVSLANYIGAPILSLFNGHMLYLSKVVKSGSGFREAWRQRHSETAGAGGYMQQLVTEMNDNDVLGTGTQVATLEVINQNDLLQAGFDKLTTVLNKASALTGERKVSADAGFSQVIQAVQDFYTFSDDAPKVLAYMINRDRATVKWKAKLSRADYDSGQQYDQAVNVNAIREASDRTLRENTDWGVAPLELKRISYNNFRFLFMDYIMHNTQMIKIVSENMRLWREDVAELKEARLNGDKAWIGAVQATLFSRGVGNVAISIPTGYVAFAGYSLTANAVNGMLRWANEQMMDIDAEDDDKDDLMGEKQTKAASRLMNFFDFDGGAKFEPFPVKRGDVIYAANYGRLSPFNTFAAPPTESNNPEVMDQTLGFFQRLLLAGGSGTNAQQLYDAIRGIDWTGARIEDRAIYWSNLQNVLAAKATPGFAKAITEGVTERAFVSGQYKPRGQTAISELGVSVKSFNVPELLNRIGSEVSRKIRSTDTVAQLRNRIKTGGGGLTRQDIVTMVLADQQHTEKLMARYSYAVEAAYEFGYTTKDLKRIMGKKQTIKPNSGLGKVSLNSLLKGENIFLGKSLKKMETLLDTLDKRQVNAATFPAEWKAKAMADVTIAIEEYERLLKGVK